MTINLVDGFAQRMGDGHFVLVQADENGVAQSVVITAGDLAAMSAGDSETAGER